MKHQPHHIFTTLASLLLKATALVLTPLVFVSCADENTIDQYADEPLQIAINTSWQCGRGIATTRALTDPVGEVDGDSKQFPDALYPEWLHITLTDGTAHVTDFSSLPGKYLVKKTYSENDNYNDQKYIAYHAVYSLANYGDDESKREKKPFYTKSQIQKLNVEANTLSNRYIDGIPQAWDNQDIATFGTVDHLTTGGAAYNVFDPLFNGRYYINRNHLFLDLGHATALLRLHFKVNKDYDKIRKIVLRSVTVKKDDANKIELNAIDNNTAFSTIDDAPGFLLSTGKQLAAYCYMKPSHDYNGNEFGSSWTNSISNGTSLTFLCTYDIYDKDEPLTSEHCTRKGVTATNTTTLKMVFNSSAVVIKAGHYYDLEITINPDYLYVLAEHDDKHHITIQ